MGPATADGAGTILAVWGSKGGVGTTTLAVNLAAEIAPTQRTVVVDLDFSAGDVAAMLDVEPRQTMSDVLRNEARLDERLLAGMVGVHPPSRLHVLAQPTDLAQRVEPAGEAVARVLGVVADAYQFAFVDCGSRLDEATLTAAAVAHRMLLVTGPDVPGVRNAWRRLQLLRSMGLGTEHVQVVVNGYDPRAGGLTPNDIARNLGRPVEVVIPHDRTVVRAVNEGRLLRALDPRTPAAVAIAGAIGAATGASPPMDAPARTRGLGWIFGRSG
jgi:pilus assembly protein CpaE